MIRDRVVERLVGVGMVSKQKDGTEIGRRRYDLKVLKKMHVTPSRGEATSSKEVEIGKKRVEGSVDFEPAERPLLVGEYLVLTMEDGHTFSFLLPRSRYNSIEPCGGIE